uniref:Uncharacterized protein n=1 Tax=Lepeophtheirus salmonis TaxID=72036 RepID=A0A0K2T0Y3_LEPSM
MQGSRGESIVRTLVRVWI